MDEGLTNNIANDSTLDMEEWVRILERKRSYFVSLGRTVRPIRHCLISRVPQRILELDRNAYEPINLSIGPYHYRKPALQVLEEKCRCLTYILRLNLEKTLQDYLQLIEGMEQEARSCYPEELVMESDEFIKMLLLDGCFLLVALHGIQGTELPKSGATEFSSVCQNNHEICEETSRHRIGENILEELASSSKGKSEFEVEQINREGCDNSIQTSNWFTTLILHDLLLLENQIPFFVVKRIYEFLGGDYDSSNLADRIGERLEILIGYVIPLAGTCRPNRFDHLLHFWHMYFRPTEDTEEPEEHSSKRYPLFPSYFNLTYEKLNIGHRSNKNKTGKNIQSSRFLKDGRRLIQWHRAEQYHEAGVHFEKRVLSEDDRHSLLDIRFANGLIEIPTVFMDRNTGSFFRNIIALEQTCPQYGNYFTSYCAFLSKIVAKPADVTLLAKRGILVHHMRSDEEVSVLLTKLGKNVDFDINGSHYLKSVCRRMEEHYQSSINRWLAWLWHNHFSNPWLSLAVLAAAIVLLCTILQTVFTFLAYLNPAKA